MTTYDVVPAFMQVFRGRLVSALRWPDLDALWAVVHQQAEQGWYIYTVGELPPTEPATAEQVRIFLAEMNQHLRREHLADYCGIVYADHVRQPSLIKIYDPHNLGVSCGYSDNPPLPGWILSTLPPVDLATTQRPPAHYRHWWQRVLV